MATTPEKPRGLRFKHILLIILLSFIGGAIALGWLAKSYGYLDGAKPAPEQVPVAVQPESSGNLALAPVPAPVTNRVDALEDRLTQINEDAAESAGNAAKAEALLAAFAARRALDSGKQLGYIGDQLQQRFGASQPQAVATILTAAQAPVTLEMLTAELTSLGNVLTTGQRDKDLWATINREFSELFVLRKEGSASPAPSQRLQRATTFIEAGNVNAAMAEVREMPGAAAASGWLTKARQYSDARKALDVIERASLISGPVPAAVVPAPLAAPATTTTPSAETAAPAAEAVQPVR